MSFSLGSHGSLFLDGRPTEIEYPPLVAPTSILTVAGQTFTVDLEGYEMTELRASPGSAPVISLTPSGLTIVESPSIGLQSQTLGVRAYTVGGQTFVANPTGFSLDSSQVLPGDAAITVSGTPISLSPSGVLFVGTSLINIPSITPAPNVFTVAGQILTANPAGFPLAGSSLSPGGKPMILSGTAITLDASGICL